MTVKSSISLTDSQDAFARGLVESGRYSSLSAVLQAGLEMLRQRTESEDLELDALRLLLTERQRAGAVKNADLVEIVGTLTGQGSRRADGGD